MRLSPEQVEDFRRLAREQIPRLHSMARRLVGDEAEDAVQDSLLKAFEHYHQLHELSAGPGWLVRILVNCCRDRLRSQARRPDEVSFEDAAQFSLYRRLIFEDPFPYSDSLHLDFLEGFGNDDVRAVLMRIPEMYRVPLVLVYMDGFLVREVADLLDTPVGTVLSHLHRGRKLFEMQLWKYAEETGRLEQERVR
jgi:RNA polymerase sigma-70 factor (ECF subfamily)